jgi:hypothetical protein
LPLKKTKTMMNLLWHWTKFMFHLTKNSIRFVIHSLPVRSLDKAKNFPWQLNFEIDSTLSCGHLSLSTWLIHKSCWTEACHLRTNLQLDIQENWLVGLRYEVDSKNINQNWKSKLNSIRQSVQDLVSVFQPIFSMLLTSQYRLFPPIRELHLDGELVA